MAKLDLWGSILLVVLVIMTASTIIGFKTTNDNINNLAKITASQSPSQLALAPRTPDIGNIGPATIKSEKHILRAVNFTCFQLSLEN